MQTALRKMGNSTGVILPRSILGELGVTAGTVMQVSVEGDRVLLTPVRDDRQAGWAEAAAAIGADGTPDEAAWRDAGHEGDAQLVW